MKKIKNISLVLLFIISISSCYKYYDINVPDSEQKTVINGILLSDSILPVFITKSMKLGDYVDSNDIKYIDTASVELYKNNTFLEKLSNIEKGTYLSTNLIEADTNYSVHIKNGKQNFDVNCTVPQKQNIQSIEYLDYDSINNDYRIKITLLDSQGSDYYGFSAFMYTPYPLFDTSENIIGYKIIKSPMFFEPLTNQNLFTYTSEMSPFFQGQIIDDDLFNGQTFSVIFSMQNPSSIVYADSNIVIDSLQIYFELYKFDYNLFNYLISLTKYEMSVDNPMVEPVNVYSNIAGGIGVIGAASKTLDSIKLPFIPTNYYYNKK